ncbi:MAG: hypothetical protein IJU66_07010 [Oscillospiraceae bacterium]|nr:hypothetical protein [Oscillospiraceae bacterium]
MYQQTGNEGRLLILFVLFLSLSFFSLIAAWIRGRRWGDLSSGRRSGEALHSDERKALARSRRACLLWAAASVLFAAAAFRFLQ